MTVDYFEGPVADRGPYSSGDMSQGLTRLNVVRFYVTIFALPAFLMVLGVAAWINSDASRPVAAVEAVATESSRPLGGEDKAPADWTGDGVADGWLFGEWLPGQTGNVYLLNGEQVSEPLSAPYYAALVLLCLLGALLLLALVGLFISDAVWLRARREASEDYSFAYAGEESKTSGGLFRPRRISRLVGDKASRALLALFAFHLSPRVASVALGNPRTPSWVLGLALSVRGGRLLGCIAGNPSSSPATLRKVAAKLHYSHLVVEALVRNPSASAEVLDSAILACQEGKFGMPSAYPGIIGAVICHPQCSEATAARLLEGDVKFDYYYDISQSHYAVATSDSAPVSSLSWLAHNSRDLRITRAVALNPRTPAEDAALAALLG